METEAKRPPRSERAEQQALLHFWIDRSQHEALKAHSRELGLSITYLARVALAIGVKQILQGQEPSLSKVMSNEGGPR